MDQVKEVFKAKGDPEQFKWGIIFIGEQGQEEEGRFKNNENLNINLNIVRILNTLGLKEN